MWFSLPGVVQPDQPGCQVLPVLVSLLDGLDELLPGDPLVLVLVHLPEDLLTPVALSVALEEDVQVCDDFLHLPLADGAALVHVEHLEHSAQGLLEVSEGQNVVNKNELLLHWT